MGREGRQNLKKKNKNRFFLGQPVRTDNGVDREHWHGEDPDGEVRHGQGEQKVVGDCLEIFLQMRSRS